MSNVGIVLLILLILLLVGGLPHWPYAASYGWGYYPSGFFGLALLIVIILLIMGKL